MWFIVLIHGKTQKKTEPDSGLLATEERRIARKWIMKNEEFENCVVYGELTDVFLDIHVEAREWCVRW